MNRRMQSIGTSGYVCDWDTNKSLQKLQEAIIASMDLSKEMSDEEIKEIIDGKILEAGKTHPLDLEDKKYLRREIFFAIRKLGILQELLLDPDITEIMVNGTDPVFVEKEGKLLQLSLRFDSKEKLGQVIQQIAADGNKVVNESSPIADTRLQDGSRVNVVLAPVAINGPILTIRRFPERTMTMEKLIGMGALDDKVAVFLETAVKAGYNILVSGGTGCGKTTMLNALSGFIPSCERVISIEDSAELMLQGLPNLVRLETRNANVEGGKEITIRDLLKTSLRMRPDRIIVGEVRGKEAIDMLQSMNVGHNAMTTVHANSTKDVVSRLETMVLMGMELPVGAIRRQIASGFDLMIHLGRVRDGSRKLLEIAEPYIDNSGEIEMNTLFRFRETGLEKERSVLGEWEKTGESIHVEKLMAAGLR